MLMKMNNMINNFSVVIPVFNEEEVFLESANKIYKICQEMNKPFEIIFSLTRKLSQRMLINVDAYFLSNFGEVEFGVFSISFFLVVTIKNYQRNLF